MVERRPVVAGGERRESEGSRHWDECKSLLKPVGRAMRAPDWLGLARPGVPKRQSGNLRSSWVVVISAERPSDSSSDSSGNLVTQRYEDEDQYNLPSDGWLPATGRKQKMLMDRPDPLVCLASMSISALETDTN